MKILLIGPPASGKGTIGKMLKEKFDIPLISVGQLLRDFPKDSPLFEKIDNTMDKGELVSQDLVAELLRNETLRGKYRNGYILDGWSRRLVELEYFNPGFDKVIFLNISDETVLKRITSRRTCEKCGEIYNTIFKPPKAKGVCDIDGGKLVQRDDETKEATDERLEIYHTDTKEVLDYFKEKGILLEVDAEPLPKEVFRSVIKALAL